MSHSSPATSRPARTRRRPAAMALDTRHSRNRRRVVTPQWDWHDGLIPSGVLSVLGGIVAYHHAVFANAFSLIF